MSSLDRPLSGDVLVFILDHERDEILASTTSRLTPRSRTVLKDGALRVTMIALDPGAGIAEHTANGPILVQTLSGSIRFSALGKTHELEAGHMLALGGGVPHAVSSDIGGTFLLTMCVTT